MNELQPLHLLKESYVPKNNYLEDGFNKESSNIIKKDVVQENSYANMRIQNKINSYLEIYKNEITNNKIPISIHILCMEDVSQPSDYENLYNKHTMQVDTRCSNNQINKKIVEINNQKENIITNDNSECLDFMYSIPLEEKIVDSVLEYSLKEKNVNNVQDLIEDTILIDKGNNLDEQSITILNMNENSHIIDKEKYTNKKNYNLKQINTKNNNRTTKNLTLKYYNDTDHKSNARCNEDANNKVLIRTHKMRNVEVQIDLLCSLQDVGMQTSLIDLLERENQFFDEKQIDYKHPKQYFHNENIQKILPSNMITKNNDIKKLSYPIIECNKVTSISEIVLDSNTILEKSKNFQTKDCSSLMSMVDLPKMTTNILRKESQHTSKKEFGLKTKNEKNEKIINKESHIEEQNVPKQKHLCQDHKSKACKIETNLHIFQNIIEDSKSNLKISNNYNDQIENLKGKKKYEFTISNNLKYISGNELNKFLVTNSNKEKTDEIECVEKNIKECINLMLFDINSCKLENDQQLCQNFNNIVNNKEKCITPYLQMKIFNDDNEHDITPLKNQNEDKDLTIVSINNSNPLSTFSKVEKSRALYKSCRIFNEQYNNLESSLLNENKNLDDNNTFEIEANDKIIDNYNDTISNGFESSLSQSYSLTPEDGGILRNKKKMIDDAIENEKSLKLKNFEKSLNSLSEKSHTYKKRYMEKTCDEYNSLKSSIPPNTSTSASIKYNVKVHPTKADTLYPCNPYPFSKLDFNKKKSERLSSSNLYSYKTKEFNTKKFRNESNKTNSNVINHSFKHKFQKQRASKPLFEMKKEIVTLLSPRQDITLTYNEIYNDESLSKIAKLKSNLQYFKNPQCTKDDKVISESGKIQFLHNENEDAKHEIFVPFIFDDARFFMSNASCHKKQERISSNFKKTKVIIPDTCIISTDCLQSQQSSPWLPIANSKFVLQNDNDHFHKKDSKNQQHCHQEVAKICYFAQDITKKRMEGDIILQITPREGMKTDINIENEHLTIRDKLDEESSYVDEKYHVKKEYGKPCCCDPSTGHATTCYQYVPNYEPPEVTRIKESSTLDDLRAHMNYDEQFLQQFIALPKGSNRNIQIIVINLNNK